MKFKSSVMYRRKFQVLFASRSVQAAMMTLGPGGKSDEELCNEHPRAEQWLYVIAGYGRLRVGSAEKRVRIQRLKVGDVVLIEKGERHQVENTGKQVLRTINFYSPPAYGAGGEVRPTAKRA
jgi:mannose-6-phosphate isomerase-like protein (cupin superfamily)